VIALYKFGILFDFQEAIVIVKFDVMVYRIALFLLVGTLFIGCSLFENQGVEIGLPTISVVCTSAVPDSDVVSIKSRIDAETYKADKLVRARLVTKDKCFMVAQVIQIIDSFTFEDNKLALAKELYSQTVDRNQYDIRLTEGFNRVNHLRLALLT